MIDTFQAISLIYMIWDLINKNLIHTYPKSHNRLCHAYTQFCHITSKDDTTQGYGPTIIIGYQKVHLPKMFCFVAKKVHLPKNMLYVTENIWHDHIKLYIYDEKYLPRVCCEDNELNRRREVSSVHR